MRFCLFTLACLLGFSALAQQAPQWGNLIPGPYAVGYKTIHLTDPTRHYFTNGRPLQIYVWYPAQKGTQQMLYSAYLDDAVYDWGKDPQKVELLKKYLLRDFKNSALAPSYPAGLPDSIYNKILNTAVPVYRNAAPETGNFPVLLHAHSNGALMQSIMLEYLASYGYVVMSISAYGSEPVFYGRGEDGNNAVLNLTLDLALVLAEAKKLEFADTEKAGAVGMMAQAALSLQMKESPLKAIACLDCTWPADFKKLPYYEVKKANIPMAEVVNTDFAQQQTSFLDSLPYAERFIGRFQVFPYADFYPFPKIARAAESKGFTNYEYLSVFTVRFFNSIFKNDADAKSFREKPSADQTDWPKGYLFIAKKAALPAPPTENEFLGWLRYNDMARVNEAWKNFGKSILTSPDKLFFITLFLVRDQESNAWDAVKIMAEAFPADPRLVALMQRTGQALLDRRLFDQALEVYTLFAKQFPTSPYAYNGLAEVYWSKKDKVKARENAHKTQDLLKQAGIPQKEKDYLLNNAQAIIDSK